MQAGISKNFFLDSAVAFDMQAFEQYFTFFLYDLKDPPQNSQTQSVLCLSLFLSFLAVL